MGGTEVNHQWQVDSGKGKKKRYSELKRGSPRNTKRKRKGEGKSIIRRDEYSGEERQIKESMKDRYKKSQGHWCG